MIFLRAKEFIKYHLVNNFISNLILIIHIAVILSVSLFLYTKSVKADDHFDREPWTFSVEPKPLIFKHGNITYGNKFFIIPNQDCSADLMGWFSSYNKTKLKELEGKITDLRFELLTNQKSIHLSNRSRISYILEPDLWDATPMPFSVASISLGRLEKITRLLDMKKDGIIGLRLSAPNDEYFDVPKEEWSFEGIEDAISKVLKWCGPKV
jgi:hypothetical protein